jgi:hypothetical protein
LWKGVIEPCVRLLSWLAGGAGAVPLRGPARTALSAWPVPAGSAGTGTASGTSTAGTRPASRGPKVIRERG